MIFFKCTKTIGYQHKMKGSNGPEQIILAKADWITQKPTTMLSSKKCETKVGIRTVYKHLQAVNPSPNKPNKKQQ